MKIVVDYKGNSGPVASAYLGIKVIESLLLTYEKNGKNFLDFAVLVAELEIVWNNFHEMNETQKTAFGIPNFAQEDRALVAHASGFLSLFNTQKDGVKSYYDQVLQQIATRMHGQFSEPPAVSSTQDAAKTSFEINPLCVFMLSQVKKKFLLSKTNTFLKVAMEVLVAKYVMEEYSKSFEATAFGRVISQSIREQYNALVRNCKDEELDAILSNRDPFYTLRQTRNIYAHEKNIDLQGGANVEHPLSLMNNLLNAIGFSEAEYTALAQEFRTPKAVNPSREEESDGLRPIEAATEQTKTKKSQKKQSPEKIKPEAKVKASANTPKLKGPEFIDYDAISESSKKLSALFIGIIGIAQKFKMEKCEKRYHDHLLKQQKNITLKSFEVAKELKKGVYQKYVDQSLMDDLIYDLSRVKSFLDLNEEHREKHLEEYVNKLQTDLLRIMKQDLFDPNARIVVAVANFLHGNEKVWTAHILDLNLDKETKTINDLEVSTQKYSPAKLASFASFQPELLKMIIEKGTHSDLLSLFRYVIAGSNSSLLEEFCKTCHEKRVDVRKMINDTTLIMTDPTKDNYESDTHDMKVMKYIQYQLLSVPLTVKPYAKREEYNEAQKTMKDLQGCKKVLLKYGAVELSQDPVTKEDPTADCFRSMFYLQVLQNYLPLIPDEADTTLSDLGYSGRESYLHRVDDFGYLYLI